MNRREFMRGLGIAMGALGVATVIPKEWADLDKPMATTEGIVTTTGSEPMLMPVRLYEQTTLVGYGLASSHDGEHWVATFAPGELPHTLVTHYEYDLLAHTRSGQFQPSFWMQSEDSLDVNIDVKLRWDN
jgi:hypothetical protein